MATAGGTEIIENGWLRRERAVLLDLLRGLTDDEWTRPTECPEWNVKQVALHLLGDDLSLLSRQRDEATNSLVHFAQGHPGMTVDQLLNGFNEQWVTAATYCSGRVVIEMLKVTGDWTAAWYEAVDLSSPGEPVLFFGSSEPSPYWQIANREFVERWVHQLQIRRAVDAPDPNGDLLAVAAGVFVRSIALQLDDLGLADGASIGIELPGLAGWSLQWDSGASRWNLADNLDPAAVATVVFRTDTADRILSRAPLTAEHSDAVTSTGDPTVGGAAIASIAGIFT